MIIAYLSSDIQAHATEFDPLALADLVDKSIPFTPPIDPAILTDMASSPDDQYVLIARAPEMGGQVKHRNLAVELANSDCNPGNVAFVDLNAIIPVCDGQAPFLHQLRLHVALGLTRLQQTRKNPRASTPPLQSILIIGRPSDPAFAKTLQASGIVVQTLWSGSAEDAALSPQQLSGLPGHYRLTCMDAAGTPQVIAMGALAIFQESLTQDQIKALSAGLLLPIRDERLHLPPHQLRLSQAVRVCDATTSIQDACDFFLSVLLRPVVPHFIEDPVVDHTKCGLCGTCVKTCMFHASAIEQNGHAGVSTVYPQYCVACGNCVTACPTQARDLPAYSYAFYESAWTELRSFQGDSNGLRILVIYCASNGHDAIRTMAEQGMRAPSACLFLKIRCGARVDTQFIPDSFHAGFDGVAVLVCSREECDNIVGSLDLERRLNLYRRVMQATGIETGRMRILPVSAKQLGNVAAALTQFAEFLEHLKQDKQLFGAMMR